MKPYYIFLDDMRNPHDVVWEQIPNKPWTIVRSYNDFVQYIENVGYVPEFICYDHDLADSHYKSLPHLNKSYGKIDYNSFKEKTGYECAKWMVRYCIERGIKHPPYVVHSMNPVGKLNIISWIESYNKSIG